MDEKQLRAKISRLESKLHKQMAKANKTREKLERARVQDINNADRGFSHPASS